MGLCEICGRLIEDSGVICTDCQKKYARFKKKALILRMVMAFFLAVVALSFMLAALYLRKG